MSSLDLSRPLFDPSRGFVVKSAFYGNGRHFKEGDRFDPRDADCDERRVRMLWEQRYIDCRPAEGEKPPAAPAAPEPAPPRESLGDPEE